MISKERYKEFSDTVEKYTRAIDTKQSTEVKGTVKKVVFYRLIWAESLLWFSFVQFLFILLGLMDDVINNINSGIAQFSSLFGITNPFQFPVDIAAFIVIVLIIFFFCFGFIGYKYLKTPQTTNLISVRNSGAYFMMYDMYRDIQEELRLLKEEKK